MSKNPRIYAFKVADPKSVKLIKIGQTDGDVEKRIKQQFPTFAKGKEPYEILLDESRKRDDGSVFTDRDVHEHLVNKEFKKYKEWIECDIDDVKAAIAAIKRGIKNEENRTQNFKMRPEQKDAVEITAKYFRDWKAENKPKEPKFLWNAKMRFGKTFTTYQLAKEMGWKNILILTFKPAVETAWEQDAIRHIDFHGWQYISQNNTQKVNDLDKNKPIVCFGSFQYYLRSDIDSEMREWVKSRNWDCIIFDEYHFGAWRERAKKLTEDDSNADLETDIKEEQPDEIDIEEMPITAHHFLYLSGTPFRAIASGEFAEDNIYNWSYHDEQEAKRDWDEAEPNPYKDLPRMNLLTYEMPENIKKIAVDTDHNEFDLNGFFKTNEEGKFIYEDDINKWLSLIREGEPENALQELKIRKDNPSDNKYEGKNYVTILNSLSHTLWFLPSVASCFAMKELLLQHHLYREYEPVLVAGKEGGSGAKAKIPVDEAMERYGKSPLQTKTITLTCGKLTTGVTLAPLSGVFMLRNLKSAETYFQTAFRAQNQWVGKEDCYVIDFAPNRALKQIVNYVEKAVNNTATSASETDSLETGLEDFINFLPIISYKGGRMYQLGVEAIKDIAITGLTDKYITKVWRNSDLINLEKSIIEEIMNNPEAMEVIGKIEALIKDSGNNNLDIIIKKTKEINDMKKAGKSKKEMSQEEKALKDAKTKIEKKIKKFVARIPVFMYLTDYREKDLKDVIEKFDVELFKKVTGIDKDDLKILTDIGVFNKNTMDIAISEFKRYEDRSFEYIGKEAHKAD